MWHQWASVHQNSQALSGDEFECLWGHFAQITKTYFLIVLVSFFQVRCCQVLPQTVLIWTIFSAESSAKENRSQWGLLISHSNSNTNSGRHLWVFLSNFFNAASAPKQIPFTLIVSKQHATYSHTKIHLLILGSGCVFLKSVIMDGLSWLMPEMFYRNCMLQIGAVKSVKYIFYHATSVYCLDWHEYYVWLQGRGYC